MNEPNETATINGNPGDLDPMERAEETPDVKVLQEELQYAWDQDCTTYNSTAYKEDVRYARWHGQTADGLKHRERMGDRAQPYDGAPDTRIMVADDVINSLVDVLYAAFFGARVKTAPTTARTLNVAQAAEWRAVISWMLHGPLRGTLIDDVERAAQWQNTIGWCVLHPNWRKEKVMKMQTLTMQQIIQLAAQAAPPPQGQPAAGQNPNPPPAPPQSSLEARAPEMIMDPALEDAAVELFMTFFPGMNKRESRRVVKQLREDQTADFPVETDGPNVPELRVLIPGQHFVMPPESTALPGEERWMAVREFLSEQGVRARAAEEDWNEKFTERLCKQKGMALNESAIEHAVDENMKDIEFFYMYQKRNSDNGVPGLYCTVLSMFVNPSAGKDTSEADYGYHRLAGFAHHQQPFIILQTEVTGLRPMDARGVPEIVMTQQNEMKNSRDLTYIFQQLSVCPPLQKKGAQASKLPPGLTPMGIVNNVNGGEWSWFPPPDGNPEVAFKLIEMVRKEVEDHFGIARPDSIPSRAMGRMQRIVTRWLAKWGEALWQLSVLAYQNLSPAELQEILGRKPLLNADLVAQQRLMLWFETRSMDSDWLDDMIKNIIQLLQVDTGGTIDRSKLINFLLAYMDPALGEEVTLDQAGAKQAMFKEVRDEIDSIMAGNKPMLRENDPTAGMKLEFGKQVVMGNARYKMALTAKLPNGQSNPNFQEDRAADLQTYQKNLEHNHQEMVTSKMQGRLGTKDTGTGPMSEGAK